MDHSPRECQICGESHCLAGCVPVWDCLMKVRNKKKVVIEVLGGVAEVTQCPEGVEVEIIDHDNERR